MTNEKAGLIGLGTALPDYRADQADLAEWLCDHFSYSDRQARFVRRIHQRSGISQRYSVLPDFTERPRGRLFARGIAPDVQARMEVYAAEAPPLAARACEKALSEAGLAAQEITHLILVTSTGFMTPGPDIALQRRLGLKESVERTVIAMHGCAGGTVGISLATQLVGADPGAKVLMVSVEICSIHLGAGDGREAMVANSLFADGSAAAVVSSIREGGRCLATFGKRHTVVVRDSEDLLSWRLLASGFELRLARELPDRLRERVGGFIDSFQNIIDLRGSDSLATTSWSVHPGGAAILRALRAGLSLTAADLSSSEATLRDYGNLSSAAVLFVLDREIRTPRGDQSCGRGMMMSIGPGMCLDAMEYSLRG